jgi:hypothetical protein
MQNKYIISIAIIFLLALTIVTATTTLITDNPKAYTIGFRTEQEKEQCKDVTEIRAKMFCYGFIQK